MPGKKEATAFFYALQTQHFKSIGLHIAALFLVFYLTSKHTDVFFYSEHPIFADLVTILVAYLALTILFTVSRAFILSIYRSRNNFEHDHIDNYIIGTHALLTVLYGIFFGLFVMHILVVPISELLTMLSLIAVFIGIVFKENISNFVNGLHIMFSGKFKLREYVKIGDSRGRVKDLTLTHIELISESKDIVYIPNHVALSRDIVNYSKSKVRNVFIDFVLPQDLYEYAGELRARIFDDVSAEFAGVIDSRDDMQIDVVALEEDKSTWRVEYVVSRYNFTVEKKLRNYTANLLLGFIVEKRKKKKVETDIGG